MAKISISSLSLCGVCILCIAVCFQLLGVPGSLLEFADFEDEFQASIMTGFTITAGVVSLLPGLICSFTVSDHPSVSAFLASDIPFHPPLF